MGVPVIAWQPWCENAVRLHAEGKGAGEIARVLGKDTLDIIAVMDMPQFKEALDVKRQALDVLFYERIVNLWDLSETMVTVARETAQAYLDRLANEGVYEDALQAELQSKKPDKEVIKNLARLCGDKQISALRSDAIKVMADVLDRIGLRAPERIEQKITSRSETADVTPMAVYEKRLELIREYKSLGEPVPEGLAKVDLDG